MPTLPCPELPVDTFACPVNSGPSGQLPPGPSGFTNTTQNPCPVEIWAVIVTTYSDGLHDWSEVQYVSGGGWAAGGLSGAYCATPTNEWAAREVNGNLVLPGTIVRLKFVGSLKRCPADPKAQCIPVFEYCCTHVFEPSAPPTCPAC